MCEQEPETENGFGKDIKDGVSNDLRVDIDDMATLSKTPNDWVESPQDEGEAANGSVKGLGLAILASHSGTAIHGELIDNDQVGNASPGVPSPSLASPVTEGSKQAAQNHNEVGNYSDQDIGATEPGQKSKIQQEKGSGDTPVNISCPVDCPDVILMCVWNSLVCLGFRIRGGPNAISCGHCKVGQEGKCGDEGSQDMEQAFLHWNTVCHAVEGE